MSRSQAMIALLQPFQRRSKVYQAIFDAESVQLDSRGAMLADLQLQLSVDTATWGLAIYEKELGIPTDISKPLADRRSIIKSRIRGSGQVDAALIKIVADSYTNGDVNVTFDGSIRIEFVSITGIPPNLDDLKMAIEEIKPAHLPVTYVFNYMTWDDLDALGLTWDGLDARGLTWDEFEKYV